MRVSERFLSEAALRHMLDSMQRMGKYQDQISSGKRIRRPEDDPVAVARALNFRSGLASVAQSLRNIDASTNWLNATDTALQSLVDVTQQAQRLTLAGANDALSQDERQALASQVEELFEQLVQIGNSRYQGRYLFSGFKTDTAPFSVDGQPPSQVNYHGDQGQMVHEIEPGITMTVNLIGEDVFMDLFSTLISLRDALRTGSGEDIAPFKDDLDAALTSALDTRAALGAKINRLQNTTTRLHEVETDLAGFLSQAEDLDIAEAILKFSAEEYTYQAALAVNARILRTSLIDFLTW